MAAPQTWKEFEDQINKFGKNLRSEFKKELDNATKNGASITSDNLRNIIVGVANNPKHVSGLQLVSDAIIGHHNPRANDPRNTQKAEVRQTQRGPDAQLKLPRWAAGFDGLPIPSNVNNDNKAGVLNQYNKAVNELVNRMKNEFKPRPKMAPMPSRPAPKPDRH